MAGTKDASAFNKVVSGGLVPKPKIGRKLQSQRPMCVISCHQALVHKESWYSLQRGAFLIIKYLKMDSNVEMVVENAVIDWTNTRNKGVRSFDGQSVGVVVAEKKGEEYFIVESTSGHKKYRIPKNKVAGFNGSELELSLTLKETFEYGGNI